MAQRSSLTDFKTPFDSLTLCAVVAELIDRLVGGQVQDIRQPAPTELRIGIRSHGRSHILALSCDARFARVHLTAAKAANAVVPPSFCMALRKHCEGAVVRAVRQRGFDRIIEIEIGPRGPEADSAAVTLVGELMGKHSNLMLVSNSGVILEAAKRISRKVNRFREVQPGLSYEPPPEQSGRLDPFSPDTVVQIMAELSPPAGAAEQDPADLLTGRVAGMSPFLARDIVLRISEQDVRVVARLPAIWSSIFGAAETGAFRPVAIGAAERCVAAYPFPIAQFPPDAQEPVPDLNMALDTAYSSAVARSTASAQYSDLSGKIERDRKRLARQREMAERTLREGDRAEEYKQAGELVLANLWQIETGKSSVTLQDYFDPELRERTIALDPRLSAQENADALFRRYRKVRDGQSTAEVRRADADRLLAIADEALAMLKSLEDSERPRAAEIAGLQAGLKSAGLLAERRGDSDDDGAPGPDLQGHKIRRFTSPEGYDILLGETATANDYLTTRLASSNDLWLHVRASTSAHVIIKTNGRPEAVPKSVIQYAAVLCARHSSQKHSSLVPVDYTLKKHVRKPRGAAPGSADYHHETTLHVTL